MSTIKQGSTVDWTFTANADLIPAVTVRLLASLGGQTIIDADVKANVTLITPDPPSSSIIYSPTDADVATPGELRCEIHVTWPGGKKQTFPHAGHETIIIEPAIPALP